MSSINEVIDQLASEGFGPTLNQMGFSYKRRRFLKNSEECILVLNMNLRKIRGTEAGYFEICPAIKFEDLERVAAALEGKTYEKKWPTTAANIGNLRPNRMLLEWPVTVSTDIIALGQMISDNIMEYAVPYWSSFNTIRGLISGYEKKDPRLTLAGNSYKWKMVAAYCLVGDRNKAKGVLENWKNGKPSEEILNQANDMISKIFERG